MKIIFLLLFTVGLTITWSISLNAQSFTRPVGIYALSSGSKTPLPRLKNIRDLPFVDGYAWRVGWKDFEINQGVFDFSAIDKVVAALEPLGQKLNLGMHAGQVPDYILTLPNVITYVATGTGGDFTTVVPWDTTVLGLWETFYQALAGHQLPDASLGGQLVAFRDHPVLAQVRAQLPGLGAGIRDRGNRLTSVPNFDRDTFTTAALRAIHASVDLFPDKFHDIPFFPDMNDGGSNPTILEHLLNKFRTEFDGVQNPRLGLFEENLACETPSTQFAWPLLQEKENTFVNFQMLQAWKNPFSNPDKTNICLTDTTGPDVGIAYGFNTYNCRYFEIYVVDLDWTGFANALQIWHDIIVNANPTSVEENSGSPPADFRLEQNYPNPFNPETTIQYSVTNPSYVQIKIYNTLGQIIRTLVNERKVAGNYRVIWSGRDELDRSVASGVYIYSMHVAGQALQKKLVLLR